MVFSEFQTTPSISLWTDAGLTKIVFCQDGSPKLISSLKTKLSLEKLLGL